MGIIGELWREFTVAFRAGRQGGEAQQKFQDDQEIQRLGAQWGKARTPAERERAGKEAMNYIIHGPQGKSDGARLAETNELEWSDNPGAREAYLIKRWQNPYFPPPRRIFSREELSEARKDDSEKVLLAQGLFSALSKENWGASLANDHWRLAQSSGKPRRTHSVRGERRRPGKKHSPAS